MNILSGYFLVATLSVVALFAIWKFVRRESDGKAEGGSSKEALVRKMKEGFGLEDGKWNYIFLIIGFSILIIVFSKAYPDAWTVWRNNDFFWPSLFATILSFWLFTRKGYNRVMAIMILSLLILIGISNWPGRETDDTDTTIESSYVQERKEANVEYLKVTAPPFPQLSQEIDTRGYDWSCDKDMAPGLRNMNNLIAVTVKDSKGVIKTFREERLLDGRIVDMYVPDADAVWIKVSSLERYPVLSLVTLTKKL
tara:strand:+ start:1346 stop:2104 length:759 start_codon:yes stop_codon:yes gene_type:complete